VSEKLCRVLAGQTVEIGGNRQVNARKHEAGVTFCKQLLAKKIVVSFSIMFLCLFFVFTLKNLNAYSIEKLNGLLISFHSSVGLAESLTKWSACVEHHSLFLISFSTVFRGPSSFTDLADCT